MSKLFSPLIKAMLIFFSVIFIELLFVSLVGLNIDFIKSIPYAMFLGLVLASPVFLLNKLFSNIYCFILIAIVSTLACTQTIHYSYFETFYSFGKLSLISELATVSGEVSHRLSLSYFSYYLFLVPCIICVVLLHKKNEKLDIRLGAAIWLGTSIVALIGLLYIPSTYQSSESKSEDEQYLYSSLYNKVKAIETFGLYSYTIKDLTNVTLGIETQTLAEEEEDPPTPKEVIETFNAEHAFVQTSNNYTGMLEGKNVIMIMAESMSSVAIQEDLTPTLYMMKSEGISFNNHYAPVYQTATVDTEYISLTSHLPSVLSEPLPYAYYDNTFPTSLAHLFSATGYAPNSFHSYSGGFYNRSILHKSFGFWGFHDWDSLGLTRFDGFQDAINWVLDDQLLNAGYSFISSHLPEPYFAYFITTSGHLPYVRSRPELEYDLWQTILVHGESGVNYSEEVLCYLGAQRTTETALTNLVNRIESEGKLEDTVFIIYGDHYPYGLSESAQEELYGELAYDYESYQVPFIIWTPGIEGVQVDTVSSTFDILPTISNLFNLDISTGNIIGNDALNAEENLVIFADGSWLNDRAYYDTTSSRLTHLNGEISTEEAQEITDYVLEQINVSQLMLDTDYYNPSAGFHAVETDETNTQTLD